MKLSRDWLSDFVDLTGFTTEELSARFTEIGHAVEAVESHGDDTVFDLEITTNRVDAMSHLGMARELAAALGRSVVDPPHKSEPAVSNGSVPITIEAPELCLRFSGIVVRGVTVRPSPEKMRRRLAAVGLRSINNLVDVTNYVMMAVGHPLHAYDLDKLAGPAITVRSGLPNESMKSLDGEKRTITAETVVIADAAKPVGLGGIIGGEESEISATTKNILLECAYFAPSGIRRTARRLGLKTDASYRFERGVDPNDTLRTVEIARDLVLELAGGIAETPVDVVATPVAPLTLQLRDERLDLSSGGAIAPQFALELFPRLGFTAHRAGSATELVIPTYRGDIREEIDLIEEVLRFFGLNNIPASLPRLTTGDVREEPLELLETELRDLLVGCGLTEVVTYSFIHQDQNPEGEQPVLIANALNENIAAMRLSMMPGLLQTAAFNRSYGSRDGALFEVGRTYHRPEAGGESVREHHRLAFVLYGALDAHWGDAKRLFDFFDAKGIVEQIGRLAKVALAFEETDAAWFRPGKRAAARFGQARIGTVGFLSEALLGQYGLKGDVLAGEIDVEALLSARNSEWKMAPVSRFPGVPMVLGVTHAKDLEYQRVIDAINSMAVPFLHEVGLRDRFVPEGDSVVKTTLGMWYQAFDRSLTQEEVNGHHQRLAARVTELLPVTLLT